MRRRDLVWITPSSLFALPAGTSMEGAVQDVVSKAPGTVCFFAKNLDTQKSYGIRADERVRTASTIKLPIMVAVFGEVEAGRARWTDEITVRKEDKVSGSGILAELSDGIRLPLRDMVQLMIVLSDNSATNLVLDRITADTVNRYMDQYGLKQTRSLRKILGSKPGPSGVSEAGKMEENQRYGLGMSTPREMVTLLERIERGEAINRDASQKMIAILKQQHLREGIARRLTDTSVASKSGALDALRSDVGIAYTKRGRIALAITVDGMKQPNWSVDNAGHLTIAELATILVDGLGKKSSP